MRESAQIDRELEESQRETASLREDLRIVQQHEQRLRELVAAQCSRRELLRIHEQQPQRLHEIVAAHRSRREADQQALHTLREGADQA